MYNTWNNWWVPNTTFRPDTAGGFAHRNTNFVNEVNYKKPIKITKSIEDPNKTDETNEDQDNETPPNK